MGFLWILRLLMNDLGLLACDSLFEFALTWWSLPFVWLISGLVGCLYECGWFEFWGLLMFVCGGWLPSYVVGCGWGWLI